MPDHKSSVEVKLAFLKNHPIQPVSLDLDNKLPFDPNKVYFQVTSNNDKINRKWLSYCSYYKKIFCTTCMTFGNTTNTHENVSNLVNGLFVDNIKSIYSTLKKHEISKTHCAAASSLLQANLKNDIGSCININVKKVHLKEVECRRLVIKRLIDIITFIGRQGLSYRGKDEAAYNLEDRSVNHGNFLELVWLIKDYDVVLNEHIQNSIHLSNKRKEKESCNIKNANQVHGHGRGSLVTFLSKTFINKLILVIGKIIQNKIINDIKQAKLFSIMVDSTQDVSVLDQLAICVRYVLDNEVHEKLLKLVVVYDSSGKGLYDLISSEFHKLTLDISKVIGCSFDGAANMKGPYNGLQAHLKNNNPLCVYTHCVGHVLNLVMVDSSECCVNAEFLFGLVQQSSTFLLDSYKRMKVWSELTKKNHTSNEKLRKLNLIGATRWWSKDKALSSIIKLNETDIKNSRFLLFLNFLLEIISNHSTFDSKTKFTARTLLQNWSKFDVIMTAAIYLDIFNISSPISKFLQSTSLNYLTAFNMINNLHKEIRSRRDNADSIFINLYSKVKHFIIEINKELELNNSNFTVNIDFNNGKSVGRVSKKKKYAW